MPRPARQNIHRHFENVPRGSEKVPRVACLYCNHALKKDVSRMARHLLACPDYKGWASEHGGEEPDLRVLQNGRESVARRGGVSDAPGLGSSPGDMFIQHHGSHAHGHTHHAAADSTTSTPVRPVGAATRTPSDAALLAGLQGHLRGESPAEQQSLRPTPANLSQLSTNIFANGAGSKQPAPNNRAGGSLDANTRRSLDVLYARAIIAEGNQFNLYDQKNHPHMFHFLKALNPLYEPPSREAITKLLMDTFFSKEQNWA